VSLLISLVVLVIVWLCVQASLKRLNRYIAIRELEKRVSKFYVSKGVWERERTMNANLKVFAAQRNTVMSSSDAMAAGDICPTVRESVLKGDGDFDPRRRIEACADAEIIVYTVVTGADVGNPEVHGFEELLQAPDLEAFGVKSCSLLFTDTPGSQYTMHKGWVSVSVDSEYPYGRTFVRKNSRVQKILSSCFFDGVASIYIDHKRPYQHFVWENVARLHHARHEQACDYIALRHYSGPTGQQEGRQALYGHRSRVPEVLREQMREYERLADEGVYKYNVIQDCSFIYRSGNSGVYWPFERSWFAEFSYFSDRDQVAVPLALNSVFDIPAEWVMGMFDVLPTTTGGNWCYLTTPRGRYPTTKMDRPRERPEVIPDGSYKRKYPLMYDPYDWLMYPETDDEESNAVFPWHMIINDIRIW